MKLNLLLLIAATSLISCSIHKGLKRNYVFRDGSKRKLTLSFQNDSICVLKNIYACDNLENKEMHFKCRYEVLSSKYLLLINDNAYVDTTGVGYFYFPATTDLSCEFLQKKEKTEKPITIGPNYPTEYERYGKIPYVTMDTLVNHRGKLAWVKKNKDNKVVGYYEFK